LLDNDTWDRIYEYLEKYGEDLGNCNVPYRYKFKTSEYGIIKLGMWLAFQRNQYKNKSLAKYQDRYRKLTSLAKKRQIIVSRTKNFFFNDCIFYR